MPRWSNWSGRQTSQPQHIARPTEERHFVDAVTEAAKHRWPLRAVGASHSHSRVAAVDGMLVETDGWQGVISSQPPGEDGTTPTVRLRSGTRIYQLGEPLHRLGYGLINQGDIDRQSIAGATGTGTHGTGPSLGNFSTAVTGATVVLADGSVVTCSADVEPDLFDIARHSLGAVGLITELELKVRDRYRLEERQWIASPEEVFGDIDRLIAATRHFEFFWVPDRDLCACKSLDELETNTDAGDEIAEVTQVEKRVRHGWSHQIISSIRDDLHTEIEYSIPAADGPACFAELREMIRRDFPDLTWPLEYRTVAADDLMISAARGRPTVTISAHQDISLDDRPLFTACEEIFRSYGGRPHWGKVHYQTGDELAALHSEYRQWWEIRDRYDPEQLFVTPDLAALRPGH